MQFALNNLYFDDYQKIFTQKIPLLDVRAPSEFTKGAFSMATNVPILDDEERKKVGIEYKFKGKNSALNLGFELVDEEQKQARFDAWQNWHRQNPQGLIYCFRGGLRSKLTQDFLYKEFALEIPRVLGGYKKMRTFMLDAITKSAQKFKIYLLGGKTGSGKSQLLNRLANSFDLEAAAEHLGSAFGTKFKDQPSQINFEHRLAEFLLNHQANKIIFEDESRHIGKCQIPTPIFNKFQQAPVLVLQVPLAQRVENIFEQYVTQARAELIKTQGEETGAEIYAAQRLKSLAKIQDKLGGQKYHKLHNLLTQALEDLPKKRVALMHQFIEKLLLDYYDPMYEWQLQKKQNAILIEGNHQQIEEWWGSRSEQGLGIR